MPISNPGTAAAGTIPSYPPPARALDGSEPIAGWQDGAQRSIAASAIAALGAGAAAAAAQPFVNAANTAAQMSEAQAARAVAAADTVSTITSVVQYAAIYDDVAFAIGDQQSDLLAPLVDKTGHTLAYSDFDKASHVVVPSIDLPSPGGVNYAAAVIDRFSGFISPFMLSDGRLVSATIPGTRPSLVLNQDNLPPRNTFVSQPGSSTYVPPTSWYDTLSHTAILYVILGQSNSIGTSDFANPIIGGVPVYPANALMLQGGVRRHPIFGIARSQTSVPLAETQFATDNVAETGASGFANHLIRDVFAAVGVMPTVMCIAPSVGGIPYENVKRGSDVYTQAMYAIEDAVAALRSLGFTRIQTVVDRVGHESDGGYYDANGSIMSRQRIGRQYQQAERELTQDICARTGEQQPLFFLNQVHNNAGSDAWDNPHRTGIADSDGVGHLRVTGPCYQYAGAGIHYTYLNHNRQGQACARALLAEMGGVGQRPTAITNHWWVSPTRFALGCDMIGQNLVIDTSGDFLDPSVAGPHYGFDFRDGSASPPAISAVAVAGRTITIDLAAPPTGLRPQVSYALSYSGVIHDDTAHVSIYDQKANHNWLLASLIDLTR